MSNRVTLRPATLDDMPTVFAWRNDPWIIDHSVRRVVVAWEEHEAWFRRVVQADDRALWVITDEANVEMGVVRIDSASHAEAWVTIYLMRPFVGRGIGRMALEEACRRAFQTWPNLSALRAVIRTDNEASRKVFARAGFQMAEHAAEEVDSIEMILLRSPTKKAG